MTTSHSGVIERLFDTIVSSEHNEVISDRDNAHRLGISIDELIRHHPSLRPLIMEAVLALLRKAVNAGTSFVPVADQAYQYVITSEPVREIDKARTRSKTDNVPLALYTKILKVSRDSLLVKLM